jgi:protein gp37
MSENSSIEWTDHTFNTHWGCSKISPGCDGCYAQALAKRFGYGWGDDAPKREFGETHWNDLIRWDRKAAADGVRRRVFTNSMSDLFDKFAPAGVRERHWQFVQRTPNLDHLLLTKRIGNVRSMVPAAWLEPGGWPSNAWIGATVVNQEEADRDIPKLLQLPAPVRFLSVEPLLGLVDLSKEWLVPKSGGRYSFSSLPDEYRTRSVDLLDWVIVGGESGRGARPMHPSWAHALRDQCAAAGVPFLFKQWGEWQVTNVVAGGDLGADIRRDMVRIVKANGQPDGHFRRGDVLMRRVGKKAGGRLLAGLQHDGFPTVGRAA